MNPLTVAGTGVFAGTFLPEILYTDVRMPYPFRLASCRWSDRWLTLNRPAIPFQYQWQIYSMTNKKSAVLTPAAMLLLQPMFASQALAAENNEEKATPWW